jgi:trans-aconitate methyltransferase
VAAASVPERVRWAVEILAVDPGDHLLEIGCGHGAAISLICDRLDTGTITALDRSTTMVRSAERRNLADVSAGRATIHAVDLAAADLGPARFDKIFAINVNLFWVRAPTAELDLVRTLIKPSGALYLFYEPPSPARVPELASRLAVVLAGHRFTATTIATTARLCVTARTR